MVDPEPLRFYFPRQMPDPTLPVSLDNMYAPEPLQFLTVEELHWDMAEQPRVLLYSFDNTALESLLSSIRTNPLFAATFGLSAEEEYDPADLEDVKVTLSVEEFDTLDNFTSAQAGHSCTVCQEESRAGIREQYTRLRCEHYFHTSCIRRWLTTQSTRCPVCRHDQRRRGV